MAEEFTPFRFHFSNSVDVQYLHGLPGLLRDSFGIPRLVLPYRFFFLSLSALTAGPALPFLLALLPIPALHSIAALSSFPAIFPFFRPHLLLCGDAVFACICSLLFIRSLPSWT